VVRPIGSLFSTDFSTEIVHPFPAASGRLTKSIETTYAALVAWSRHDLYHVFHRRATNL
jgi:hypothetical protein